MYGPMRRITAVGEHTATGTTMTMECGHAWTLVPHMHATQREVGTMHPCGSCRAEAEAGRPEFTTVAERIAWEREQERAAIMAGAEFRYDVVGWGSTPEEALANAVHWQATNDSLGAGAALYGRTRPVRWGTPVQREWEQGGRQWAVPCWWRVAAHAEEVAP